jgi:hypothetical protein
MLSFEMLRRVALVRTDVSEEPSASMIKVTRIGEPGTLAVTTNGRTVRVTSHKTAFFRNHTVSTIGSQMAVKLSHAPVALYSPETFSGTHFSQRPN